MQSQKQSSTASTEQYQIRKKGRPVNVAISDIKAGDVYRFVVPGFASPWRTANEDAWQQAGTDTWVVTPVSARKNKSHPLAGHWKSVPK